LRSCRIAKHAPAGSLRLTLISAVGIQPQLASVLELEGSDAAAPGTFLHERELFFKRNSKRTLAAAGREGKCIQEGNKNTLLRKNHTIKK
jgi:hypothetical protein